MEKYNWICNECEKEPAGCFSNGCDEKPNSCVFEDGSVQNWQKTTAYEITKIMDKEPIDPEKEKRYEELREKLDGGFLRKFEGIPYSPATPNCAICQWKEREKYRSTHACGGQGMRKLTSVYGNKICKRLFKEKPGTEPDQE